MKVNFTNLKSSAKAKIAGHSWLMLLILGITLFPNLGAFANSANLENKNPVAPCTIQLVESHVDETCKEDNGEISTTVTGASGAVTYSWSGPNGFSANTASVSNLNAGNYIVTATDDQGCDATLNVTIADIADNIAPVVTLYNLVEFAVDTNTIVKIDPSDLIQNIVETCPYTVTYDTVALSCADVGQNIVLNVYVTDAHGNTWSGATTVRPVDITPPVIGFYDKVVIQLDENGEAVLSRSNISRRSYDLCVGKLEKGTNVNFTISRTEFDCNDLPSSSVTVTVEDLSGNSENDTYTKQIINNEVVYVKNDVNDVYTIPVYIDDCLPPVAVCDDIEVTVSSTNGIASITPEDVDLGSYDNCTGVWYETLSDSSFTCKDVGTISVNLHVYDFAGNMACCPVEVTVKYDDQKPVAVCKDTVIQLDSNGQATITAADIDGGSFDDCQLDTISIDKYTFTCSDVGDNYVTLTVCDDNGQCSECTAIVKVIGNDGVDLDVTVNNVSCFGGNDGSIYINPTNLSTDCDAFRTQTQGGWGTSCSGSNPGCYRDANFSTAFPSGLTIGCVGGYTATFTSSSAIQNFLPSVGSAGALNTNYTDATSTSAGVLAGQLVALSLSVGFDAADSSFGASPASLASLKIIAGGSTFDGMTIGDFLVIANEVIGGCNTSYTFSEVNAIATLINENFVDGTTNNGDLETPNSFVWSTGQTTNELTNLSPGTYSVTITNCGISDCPIVKTFTITEPDEIQITLNSVDPTCATGTDGSIEALVNGGTAPYTYLWSNNSSGISISNLSSGTYSVTVTDANGCSVTSDDVTLNLPPCCNVTSGGTIDGDQANCGPFDPAPINNVTLPSGGLGGVEYVWLQSYVNVPNIVGNQYWTPVPNSNSETLDPGYITQTTYYIRCSRSIGCSFYAGESNVITITVNPAPSISITKNNDVSCYGAADGSATVSVSSGTAPYTYSWTSGSKTTDANNLTPGTYTVTVMDANGCSATEQVTIDEPAELTATTSSIDASCIDAADGTASVSVNGGTAPYNYAWSNSANTPSITAQPGTYSVNITDANGCIITKSITVDFEDSVNPVARCKNITVQLSSNGSASIVAANIDNGSSDNCGIGSMTVSPSSFDCSDVGNNTVTLTVTDVNGNTATCQATVTVEDNVAPTASCQPATVFLNASGVAQVTAMDIDNGSSDACGIDNMIVNPSQFDCSHIGTPQDVVLTVTDVYGNTANCTTTVNIVDNVAPTANCKNVTLALDNNGEATISVADVNNGSTDNCGIDTMWLSKTTFDCTDGGTSTVTLYVKDASGNTSTCTSTVTIEDNEDPSILCQNITVALNSNGVATIDYTDIDFGSTDNCGIVKRTLSKTQFDCDDVGANILTYTIEDGNGNVATCNPTVYVEDYEEPTAICQSITVQLDQNGEAVVVAADVDGGSYDNCGIDKMIVSPCEFNCSNIGSNTVTLVVIDVNGNMSSCTSTVTVEDNRAPLANCKNITIELDAAGQASISASDIDNGSTDNCGIDNISISQTNFDCSHIGNNSITLTVEDVNGNISTCTSTVTVEDNEDPTITGVPANITVTANQNDCTPSVNWTPPTGDDNCSVTLTSNYNSGDDFPIGTTTVTYTAVDGSGNTATASFNVTVTPTPLVVNVTTSDVDCYGGANGTASVSVSGGCEPYSYLWSTNSTSTSLTGLSAGNYSITITDGNGSTKTVYFTIAEPTQLVASVYGSDPTCATGTDGMATVNVSGGTLPYTYLWSNSATTSSIENLTSGTYSVTVTDANGCTATGSITIARPACCNVTNAGKIGNSQENCGSFDPVAITNIISPSGGLGNVEYMWLESNTNVANTAGNPYWKPISGANGATYDPAYITQTTYYIRCSRSVGCTDWVGETNIIAMIVNPVPTVSISATDTICTGGNDGAIDLTVNSGTAPFTYAWTKDGSAFATTQDLTNLGAGTYAITVTDKNGCKETEISNIVEINGFDVTALITDVTCNDGLDGQIDLSINGNSTGGTIDTTVSDIWVEDFEDLSGTSTVDNGSTPWSLSGSPKGYAEAYDWKGDMIFEFNETDKEIIWTSGAINISNFLFASVSLEANSYKTESGDYFKVYYQIDNNSPQIMQNGDLIGHFGMETPSSTGLIGNTLKIIIKCKNDKKDEYYWFDDLIVSGAKTVTTRTANVWVETFEDNSLYATSDNGVTAWTRWHNSSNDYAKVKYNNGGKVFQMANGDAKWYSEKIDISNKSKVSVDIELGSVQGSELDASGSYVDWIRVYYKLDNGSWTYFDANYETKGELNSNNIHATVSGLSGDDLELKVWAHSTASSEYYFVDNVIVTASASGGNSNYTIEWSNNETTEDINGLAAGSYEVTVTDVDGCSVTETFNVDEPDSISINYNVSDVSCNANGYIVVTPPPVESCECEDKMKQFRVVYTGANNVNVYAYNKYKSSIFATFNNVQNGDTLTFVGQDNGKFESKTFLKVSNDPAYHEVHTSCSENIAGTHAGPFYIHSFVDGKNQYCQGTNNPNPNYSCDCEDKMTEFTVVYSGSNNVTVYGYDKYRSNNFKTFNNVQDGDTLTFVGHNNGKFDSKTFLKISTSSTYHEIHTSCSENIAGMIIGPFYVHSFVDGKHQTCIAPDNVNPLIPCLCDDKMKSFTLFYAGKSTRTVSIYNKYKNTLIKTFNNVTNGDELVVNGWSNGRCDSRTYIKLDNDNNWYEVHTSCSEDIAGKIIANDFVVVSFTDGQDNTCDNGYSRIKGKCDGVIDITVLGGTAPYTYVWDNGKLTEDLGDLCEGTYTVVVTDANGCSKTLEVNVGKTECCNVTAGGTIAQSQTNCGSFDPKVITSSTAASGGKSALQYKWMKSTTSNSYSANDNSWTEISGANSASFDPTTISTTTHYVRLAKRDGCSDWVGVSNVVTMTVNNGPPVSINQLQAPNCQNPTAILQGSINGANTGYQWYYDGNLTFPGSLDINTATPGVYTLEVYGTTCTTTVNYTVLAPTTPTVTASITDSEPVSSNCDCEGRMEQFTVVYQGSDNAKVRLYNKKKTKVKKTFTDVDNGDILVFNGYDKQGRHQAYVHLRVNSGGFTEIHTSCSINILGNTYGDFYVTGYIDGDGNACTVNTNCDGEIDLSVSGGSAPYAYSWATGESTQDIANLCPGVYTLTVTDANGCSTKKTFTVGSKTKTSRSTAADKESSINGNLSDANNEMVDASEFSVSPNPTQGSARINYIVNESATANVVITDMAGKQLINVYDGFVEGGVSQQLDVNMEQLRSGVYMIVIKTSNGESMIERVIVSH